MQLGEIVFPGDIIDTALVTSPLEIDCGIVQVGDTYVANMGGKLSRHELNGLEVLNHRSRYIPRADDVVVGTIVAKTQDFYRVDINSSKPAILMVYSFNSARKKNAPNLDVGQHVLAWVKDVRPWDETELSCVEADNIKQFSSGEVYFGLLEGEGLLVRTSLQFGRSAKGAAQALTQLGGEMPMECAVGDNGLTWVMADPENLLFAQSILQKTQKMTLSERTKVIRLKLDAK